MGGQSECVCVEGGREGGREGGFASSFIIRASIVSSSHSSGQVIGMRSRWREGQRVGGKEGGREGWVGRSGKKVFGEVGRYGCQNDGLDEADAKVREEGREEGKEGGRDGWHCLLVHPMLAGACSGRGRREGRRGGGGRADERGLEMCCDTQESRGQQLRRE